MALAVKQLRSALTLSLTLYYVHNTPQRLHSRPTVLNGEDSSETPESPSRSPPSSDAPMPDHAKTMALAVKQLRSAL
eukprot:CAMPEP_0118925558 /NCGR_PEP_ID=MMETSP1169-20130426/3434_1 /TAXON_ID=36882 /ORGANISM="Pyramimonas obovata, Strain CCMP722" /LENGTH=76 /DNA_ID=CAMNT_0006866893 /DNA_START=16 /DNA_END=243 /DNA_ORIENTATION=+